MYDLNFTQKFVQKSACYAFSIINITSSTYSHEAQWENMSYNLHLHIYFHVGVLYTVSLWWGKRKLEWRENERRGEWKNMKGMGSGGKKNRGEGEWWENKRERKEKGLRPKNLGGKEEQREREKEDGKKKRGERERLENASNCCKIPKNYCGLVDSIQILSCH